MLLALTEGDVGPVAEHALHQREEVIQERTTGRLHSSKASPRRDPAAVKALYETLTPRTASTMGATQEVGGEEEEEEEELYRWPVVHWEELNPVLSHVALGNQERGRGSQETWKGWHDPELEAPPH